MFVCQRDEFGWTTYIPYETLERVGLREEMIQRMIEVVRAEGYTVIEPEPEIIIREHIQTYYS